MFYSLGELERRVVFDGYRARIYHGEQITFAVLEVEAYAKLPVHRHENEQVGLLVSGTLTFTIDGSRRRLGPGEGWVIPANADHDAQAGAEGAIVIETWSPPRRDFLQLAELPPCTPAWPA